MVHFCQIGRFFSSINGVSGRAVNLSDDVSNTSFIILH